MKGQKTGEPKPETVAKIQRGCLVVGIIITVLGILGLVLLYAC